MCIRARDRGRRCLSHWSPRRGRKASMVRRTHAWETPIYMNHHDYVYPGSTSPGFWSCVAVLLHASCFGLGRCVIGKPSICSCRLLLEGMTFYLLSNPWQRCSPHDGQRRSQYEANIASAPALDDMYRTIGAIRLRTRTQHKSGLHKNGARFVSRREERQGQQVEPFG